MERDQGRAFKHKYPASELEKRFSAELQAQIKAA